MVSRRRCTEALLFESNRVRGVDVRVARIFNVYGPRTRADDGRAVSNFIANALAGKPSIEWKRSASLTDPAARDLLRFEHAGGMLRNILTLQTSLAGSKYATTRQVEALTRTITQRLDALPGVQASAMAINASVHSLTELGCTAVRGSPAQRPSRRYSPASPHRSRLWLGAVVTTSFGES